MKTRYFLLCIALMGAVEIQAAVGVRLLMAGGGTAATQWDGSVTASGAEIKKVEQWRFDDQDSISGTSWKMSTHRMRSFGGARAIGRQVPLVPNGVIVWLDGESDNTQLDVTTAQGNFSVRLSEIPYTKSQKYLDGRVTADRVPGSFPIASSPDEQDYPAVAADKSGNLWLAYVEFKHNPDQDRIRGNYKERPKDFSDMNAPTGGDQILVRQFTNNAWGPPIEITPAGGDVYRPAIAVDASGREWVFWSENRKGNFDVWARVIANGTPGATVQISKEPGSDVFPAAVTDSKGKVWVAWQGWRNGKASIFASTQNGDAFSPAAVVASSSSNEWNPAIAADKDGRVSVAWDSYRNGNYDVYCRTTTPAGVWGKEVAVAASPRYEAYPSIAYDRDGRLWIAYEEGSERWGKDFGAYDTAGVAIYQGRAVRLVALDRSGKLVTTNTDVGDFLPGLAAQLLPGPNTQSSITDWLKPNPDAVKGRRPSGTPIPHSSPKNTMPRLTADPSGRLWLAIRSPFPIRWAVIGSVYSEHIASYDGKTWTGPIYLAHSDNILDNRPALVSTKPGELIVITSSDGRADFQAIEMAGYPATANRRNNGRDVSKDPYNNDLYAAVVTLTPAWVPMAVKPVLKPAREGADRMEPIEKAALQRMRTFRMNNAGSDLRVVRGEFHRHSEISMDGGGDGTIIDQWRYILDAASLDWVGCCDHDNGGGREYSWWTTQKLTDIFNAPGRFAAMFSYERSVSYPEGHRNVVFVERGIRPLPRLPLSSPDTPSHAPDTLMFYDYLKKFDGVVAVHTSGTVMGTDWRDNDPNVEPVVEIYQGDRQNYEIPGGPRSNTEKDSIGGWRPKGFVSLALEMGYKMAFQASSDHVSTHMSYCNIFVTDATREGVLQGFKKRHVYGATDNILADFRSGTHMMGDAFTSSTPPELSVKLTGTGPFAKVQIVKDNKYVYTAGPGKAQVDFTWRDAAPEAGKTSYYYVRGEQQNGEIVWVSPMWITYNK